MLQWLQEMIMRESVKKGVGFPSLIDRLGIGRVGLVNCLTFMRLINSPVVSFNSVHEPVHVFFCVRVCVCVPVQEEYLRMTT